MHQRTLHTTSHAQRLWFTHGSIVGLVHTPQGITSQASLSGLGFMCVLTAMCCLPFNSITQPVTALPQEQSIEAPLLSFSRRKMNSDVPVH